MNTNTAAWAGTVFGVIGAMMVALNLGVAFLGYCFFLAGAVSYIFVAIRRKDNSLLLLNLVFAVTNLVGLWRH